ncbi:SRPBCC family protein [Sedimenticola selenatireducens]|mgnify:CR=1 FL=1|uniref:Polyketide cyclase n=1 Tax=Sedimenticola selenatireducens TaxID=191960 RepID=A0A2N6CV87_9GAMM|nr:SRPBCC family protein [Sedimenticola selenatireducens]PLX61105.1 MAG: polyketide cyclase [Sedimenticola selenatireducens]
MEINLTAPVSARATTLIDAPAARVWHILTRIEDWPAWNEQVAWTRLAGTATIGSSFHWKAGGLPIRSQLLELEPGSRIGWSGRSLGIRALHRWHLEGAGQRTRVHSEESFDGLLPRLLPGTLKRLLEQSLQQGLAALKREAERQQREASHAATT